MRFVQSFVCSSANEIVMPRQADNMIIFPSSPQPRLVSEVGLDWS